MKKYPKVDFNPWIHTPVPDKPGYVHLTSMVTFRKLKQQLESFLKNSPVYDFNHGTCMIDYFEYISFSPGYNMEIVKPLFVIGDQLPLTTRCIQASGSRGGNEGWYFHIDIIYIDNTGNGNYNTFIVLKTLSTSREIIHEIYESLNEFCYQIN